MDAMKKPQAPLTAQGAIQNLAGVLDSMATEPACVAAPTFKAAEDKRFATLAARYALAGHALSRSQSGGAQSPYYCTRWGYLRPVQSLDEAEQVLKQIAGKQ